MIEGLTAALKETTKEISNCIKDIAPDFTKGMETTTSSFEEADKPLNDNSGNDGLSKSNSDKELGKVENNNADVVSDSSNKETEYLENDKKGGAYKDLPSNGGENHHMPADSVSPLGRGDGPAINMDKTDHRQTESCGNSKEAQEYRAQQKELIEQGNFKAAQQMDIDDIHDKFGDKYDDAIKEMEEYTDMIFQNIKEV